MYRRGDVLHLPLRAAPVVGRSQRACTMAVMVEGVYARGDGELCYYLAPPSGEGVLVGAATLARLLGSRPPSDQPDQELA